MSINLNNLNPDLRGHSILDVLISSIKDSYGNITNFDCAYISLYNIGFPRKLDLFKSLPKSNDEKGITETVLHNIIDIYNKTFASRLKDYGKKNLSLLIFKKDSQTQTDIDKFKQLLGSEYNIKNNEMRCYAFYPKRFVVNTHTNQTQKINEIGHVFLSGKYNDHIFILDPQDVDYTIKHKYLYIDENECETFFAEYIKNCKDYTQGFPTNNWIDSFFIIDGGLDTIKLHLPYHQIDYLSRRHYPKYINDFSTIPQLTNGQVLADFLSADLSSSNYSQSTIVLPKNYSSYIHNVGENYDYYKGLKLIKIPLDFEHSNDLYVHTNNFYGTCSNAVIFDVPKYLNKGDLVFIKKNSIRLTPILKHYISDEFYHILIHYPREMSRCLRTISSLQKNTYINSEIIKNFLHNTFKNKVQQIYGNNFSFVKDVKFVFNKINCKINNSLNYLIIFHIFIHFKNQNDEFKTNLRYNIINTLEQMHKNSTSVYFNYWIIDPLIHFRPYIPPSYNTLIFKTVDQNDIDQNDTVGFNNNSYHDMEIMDDSQSVNVPSTTYSLGIGVENLKIEPEDSQDLELGYYNQSQNSLGGYLKKKKSNSKTKLTKNNQKKRQYIKTNKSHTRR